jgi:hypothetical protein
MQKAVGAFLLTVFAACGDDASLNAPPIGANEIRVTPSVVELTPGATQVLQVTVSDGTGRQVTSTTVSWTSSNTGVATVNSSGTVTAISVGSARIIARSSVGADSADVRVVPPAPSGPFIEVHPQVEFQEILGWEGTAQLGENECDPAAFMASQPELVSRLVNELGINRVRLETRSGHENPVDHYSAYRSSHQPSTWHPYRYQSINDNDDPGVAREGGFQFAELDHKVEVVISPMRALLAARGERLYVNLTYVDFVGAAWEQSANPAEYAELILAAFVHLQTRHGFVPDAVEIVLEPDNTQNWTAEAIGRAIVAAGDRLRAAGFRPAFIAPSNTNMRAALDYLNGVVSVPRVLEYLTDVAYHRYAGVSSETVANLASRANELGLRTAMLEHIESSYLDLHEDLRLGQNSAWQQFTLAYCEADNGAQYYFFDQNVRSGSSVVMGDRTRYLRQYFSFVRLHARRIGAVSGDSRLDPLAFRNVNGKVVVIVKATTGAPVAIRNLPPGTYGFTYTTASESFAGGSDIAVSSSGTLQVTMPAAGVLTIHQR